MQTSKNEHVPWLDGLRGIAALWVFLSHLQRSSGGQKIAIISSGRLAVDLFMLLSGFLMAHHYLLRRNAEPWNRFSTLAIFWTRRFFRIAPLYYLLLFIALAIGPWLNDYRQVIVDAWPKAAMPDTRYADQSLANILTHVSFVFGAIPEYSFRTPLPDWSIGLEMQFYLAFPFLMLAVARFGALKTGLLLSLLCLASVYVFSDFFAQFKLPSALPMKLYLFFIGMWIAHGRLQGSMKRALGLSLLLVIATNELERGHHLYGRLFLVLMMFYLMNNGSLPGSRFLDKFLDRVRHPLSGTVAKFLGDTSYAVYLVHMLFVLPIVGTLSGFPQYLNAGQTQRYIACILLTMPIVYPFAWLLHQTIEKQGIRLGKTLSHRIRPS